MSTTSIATAIARHVLIARLLEKMGFRFMRIYWIQPPQAPPVSAKKRRRAIARHPSWPWMT
jgi:hypothetical protein